MELSWAESAGDEQPQCVSRSKLNPRRRRTNGQSKLTAAIATMINAAAVCQFTFTT